MNAHQAHPGLPSAAGAMLLLNDAVKRTELQPPQSFPRIITDTAENVRTGEQGVCWTLAVQPLAHQMQENVLQQGRTPGLKAWRGSSCCAGGSVSMAVLCMRS